MKNNKVKPVAIRLAYNPHKPLTFYCTGCNKPIKVSATVCPSCGALSAPTIVVRVGKHVYDVAKPPRPNDLSYIIAINNDETSFMFVLPDEIRLPKGYNFTEQHIEEIIVALVKIHEIWLYEVHKMTNAVHKNN